MKIWFVLSAPQELLGGGEVFAIRLARWLKIRGHDVQVVARPGGRVYETARTSYLNVRALPMRNDLDLLSRGQLKRWFEAERPDAVLGAWGRDIKLAGRAARKADARIFWMQGTVLSDGSRTHRKLDAKFVDGYVVPSEFTRRNLAERGSLSPEKITVVYPGIDPRPFAPDEHAADRGDEFRRAYDISPSALVVLCLSRHVEIKGHSYLLQAWADVCRENHSAILVIAGSGPLTGNLKEQAQGLGITDRVRFVGHLPDARPALWNADVLVVPSLEEPLGIVTLEGMAASVAVIATRVGGIPEVVQDGVSGLLVEPGDTVQLRDAISRLLLSDELRHALIEGGRQRVQRFSADVCFPVLEDLVQSSLPAAEDACA